MTFINEISEVLKSTREMSGITLEEVNKDLDIPILVLEQLEEGNIGAFKDIFKLKDYLSSYSKYLGLDPNEVLDKFNEYMFEKTSKIPMDEIEKNIKEHEEEEKDKISSPYTKSVPIQNNKSFIIIIIIVIILVILAVLWSVKQITSGSTTTNILNYFNK